MITTLCLNPSIDRTVEVESLVIGGTNRLCSARNDAGGKGVNVMRVCERLGTPAHCLMTAGVSNADSFIAKVREEGLEHRLHVIRVPGEIRTNTKIVSRAGQPLTELNDKGTPLSVEALEQATQKLGDLVNDEDYVVLTGSLPPQCPQGTYARMMERINSKRCILDVGGQQLLLGLSARPLVIKPNIDELEAAIGHPLTTKEQIVDAARTLIRKGAQNVIVSMGSDGAILVTPDTACYAPPVKVKVSSTVGAGDSMVAGLLCELQRSGDLLQAFRCAVAAASASVMTEGTQPLRVEDYDRILPLVVPEVL